MNSGIYKITHLVSGRCYVGSTVDLSQRWKTHRGELNSKTHANLPLLNAWNKYGSNAFAFEVLERCSHQLLLAKEQHWMDKLSPFGCQGYNICKAAGAPMRGRKHTTATKQLMSKAHKGRKPSPQNIEACRKAQTGRRHTEEAKQKMRELANIRWADADQREQARQKSLGNTNRKGKRASSETCRKISEVQLGHKTSAATRQKMSEAQKARWDRQNKLARCA